MKILIKSRSAIERLAQKPFPKNTLLISITDVGEAPVQLANEPDMLLRVAFDDVDNDVIVDEFGADATNEQRLKIEEKYNMISSDQAHAIAKVYYENKDRITNLICQCEHGQSRSAAVASAILEFKSRRGIQIFADDRYYPNKVVFRRVFDALKDQIPVY
jgi:predicted protein tyrosine phosphatase